MLLIGSFHCRHNQHKTASNALQSQKSHVENMDDKLPQGKNFTRNGELLQQLHVYSSKDNHRI